MNPADVTSYTIDSRGPLYVVLRGAVVLGRFVSLGAAVAAISNARYAVGA